MKHAQKMSWMAALGLSLTMANAQDAKTEPPKKADDQTATADEESKPKSKAPLSLDLDLGVYDRSATHNPHKAFQYATPPAGFLIRRLTIEPNRLGDATRALIDLRGLFQDDYRADGYLSLFYGNTYLAASNSRSRFYSASPVYLQESERMISEFYGRQKIGYNASLSLTHRFIQQDQDFEPPREDLHQRTYLTAAELEGKALNGFGSLGYTNWRYFDRTQTIPDTEAKIVHASYQHDVLPGLSLEGSVARTDIDVQNASSNRVDVASVGGLWALAPDTDLNFAVSKEWLDLPDMQSAKALRRNYGFVKLNHRWPGWTGQISFASKEADRLNQARTYVENPRYNTLEALVRGSLMPAVRLTVKGSWQDLKHAPQSTINTDTQSLYWDRRTKAEAKLETGGIDWSAYGSLSAQTNNNGDRHVQVRYKNLTLGGSWQALPNLSLYAEHSQDTAAARTDEAMTPELDTLFPDGRVDVLGLNYTLGPTTFLTVDYTDYVTNNDNTLYQPQGNIRGRFLNAGLRFNTKHGYRIDLTFAPWHYEDRVFSQWDYDMTVFGIAASGRF